METATPVAGLTAAEFATRWQVDERKAESFLRAFADAGLAVQLHDSRWCASETARSDGGLLAFADVA
jgi:hypothetical protein